MLILFYTDKDFFNNWMFFMNYNKFLLYFFATLAILEAFAPSYAMDSDDDKISYCGKSHSSLETFVDEKLKAIDTAQARLLTVQSMTDSLDKVKQCDELLNFFQPYMASSAGLGQQHTEVNDALSATLTSLYSVMFQVKELTLRNLVSNYKDPSSKDIDCLSRAVNCLKESYDLSRKHRLLTENPICLDNYTDALLSLAKGSSLYAERATDFTKKASAYLTSVKTLRTLCQLKYTAEVRKEFHLGIERAVVGGSDLYYQIVSTNIFQEPESNEKFKCLTQNITLLENLLLLFEHGLADAPGWSVKEKRPSQQTNGKGKRKVKKSTSAAKWVSFLNPEDCVSVIASTYCGMLKAASNTVTQLPTNNTTLASIYQSKRQELLNCALSTYKEKVYKGEYANNPEKVGGFILARLEALAENEEPIKNFYRTLRQDYQERQRLAIVHLIKAEQAERQIYEERERQRAEENVQERKTRLNSLELRTEKAKATTPTTLELQGFDRQPEEKYKVTEPRVKPKTQGTPYLTSPTETRLEEILTINKQTITLEEDDYRIFQSLTGEIYDKHITLKEVLHLLEGGFKCTLSLATGSHNKATAPNNKMWTIPRPWDGPIPGYYHGQLMDFLLHDMGIVSGELEVQVRPAP